jgi:hypothetical protein
MEEKFTISEIKNYINSQENLCGVYFNLSPENIKAANHTFCSCEKQYPASNENYHCVMCQKPILPTPKTIEDGRPDNKVA